MKSLNRQFILMLGFLIGLTMTVQGQVSSKPYAIEIHVGDSIYRPGSKIVLPLGTPDVRVVILNVGSNPEARFIAKKVVVTAPYGIGNAQRVATFDIPAKDGSNFHVSNGLVANPTTLTFSLEGFTEIRGEKFKSWNVPHRERTFTIQYVR